MLFGRKHIVWLAANHSIGSEPANETHRRKALLDKLQTVQSHSGSSNESYEMLYNALLYINHLTMLFYMYHMLECISIKAHRITSCNPLHRAVSQPTRLTEEKIHPINCYIFSMVPQRLESPRSSSPPRSITSDL